MERFLKGTLGLATILGFSTWMATQVGRNKNINLVVFDKDHIRTPTSQIYLADPETGVIFNLTNDQYGNINPVWSTDGQQIKFITYRNGKEEVFLMNLDGSNQRLLNQASPQPQWDEGEVVNPNLSPDKSKLIWSISNGLVGKIIYITNSDNSNRKIVTQGGYVGSVPRWQPKK